MKSYNKILFITLITILFGKNPILAQDVYPGDANQDSIVNNIDLLYIGKNLGLSGPSRSIITNNFAPQPIPAAWSFNYYNINTLYSDCNGDGSIDDNDTLAIHENYNLNYGNIPNSYYNENSNFLEINVNKDTITLGDTLVLSFTKNNIGFTLGMAFSVKFDSPFSNLISSFSYNSNTVWFSGTENLTLSKQNDALKAFELAIVRKDGFEQFGSGGMGDLSIIIEEDLLGGIVPNSGFFNFELQKVINSDFYNIDTLGNSTKRIYFKNTVSTIAETTIPTTEFKVYPTISNSIINIEKSRNTTEATFGISNISGEIEMEGVLIQNISQFDMSNLANGIYFLIINNNNKIITHKIIKL